MKFQIISFLLLEGLIHLLNGEIGVPHDRLFVALFGDNCVDGYLILEKQVVYSHFR